MAKPTTSGSDYKVSQPSVIFILTDDQGYGDLSCHGNPILKTPNLDRLHAESARFTDFHVAPMCTPTRGELLTGQFAIRNGATFVCMGRSLIDPKLPTLADTFTQNGYRTGHFGKWHLGDNYPHRPQDRGFQETIHHPAWGITSAADYFGNDYFDDTFRHNGMNKPFEGYCTDVWFEEAMKWIDNNDARPFFAYIATNAPHTPLWVPDNYRQPYLEHVDYNVASFFGMIANIDENVGQLEQFLIEKGLRDNTVLIYMTDNGTAIADKVYNAGMRGKKTEYYEGGHRVPLFIRWPKGKLGEPRDIADTAHGVDFLPTLADLCGLEGNDSRQDGVSLGGLLRQSDSSLENRTIYIQYGQAANEANRGTQKGHASVLWNKWRLVHNEELYDLDTDPGQAQNVIDQHPEVVDRLRTDYESWWDEVGSNLELYHPITIGSEAENPVRLSSCDWMTVYCDNPNGIRGCVMDSGIWQLTLDQPGEYEVTLRRWPEESELGISEPAPELEGVDGTLPEGKALPVTSAWMQIGDQEAETSVSSGDTAVTMQVALDSGPTTLQTWWRDKKGQKLAGAYYVTVKRL